MRMTREELLERYPTWNEHRHDICKVKYGEVPLKKWDETEYKRFLELDGTLANLMAAEAYVYTQNGDYYIYDTLIGRVCITVDGRVLHGDINVYYNGRNSICLNQMYGFNALDILKIGQTVVGFSNADGIGSPSAYAKEMDEDVLEKIVNMKMEDYGDSIQMFMQAVRELYYADTTNYIMNKLFKL